MAALWAYCTAYKTAVGQTPFRLTYGTEAILPVEFFVPSLRISLQERWEGKEAWTQRLVELERLSKTHLLATHALICEKA